MSEQLAQQLLQRQKKMRMVGIGVLISLVTVLLGYTVTVWWQNRPQIEVAVLVSPTSDTGGTDEVEQNLANPIKGQGNNSSQPAPALSQQDKTRQMQDGISQSSQAGATDEQTRKNLQADLAQLDIDLQALEQNTGLYTFAAAELTDFRLALDKAYAAYGVAEYVKASMILDALAIELPDLVKRWETTYLARHSAAQTSYNAALEYVIGPKSQVQMTQAINMAQLLNAQTKTLAPNFAAANALAKDIDAFPQLRAARQALAVAQAENNIEKEIKALQTLLKINPNLVQEQADLARLQENVRQAKFARLMATALASHESGNEAQALQALSEADAIIPNSKAVSDVKQQINTEKASAAQAKLLRQIHMTQQFDDWQTTALLAQKGVKTYPNNASLQETLTLSQSILNVQTTLQRLLTAPERLADENIRRYAQTQLLTAQSLLALSPTLAQYSQTLSAAMAEQVAPITITVRSDNRSSLSVQGVGKMGTVTQRTLKLAPGTYVFVAQRQGYQTKRQTVAVVPDKEIVVDLSCDEKI